MRTTTTLEQANALRSAGEQVKQALAGLDAAERQCAAAGSAAASAEAELREGLAALDPARPDSTHVLVETQGRVALWKTWLHVQGWPRLRSCLDGLAAELKAVEPALKAIVQPRCVEESPASLCGWALQLTTLPDDTGGRAAKLRQIAGVVLKDVSIVMSARRGALLSDSERFSHVYQDGGFRRPLSQQEIFNGVAME